MTNHSKFSTWIAPVTCAVAALVIRLVALNAFESSVLFQPLEGGAHDRSIYTDAIRSVASGENWPAGAFEFLPLYPWLAGLISSTFGPGALVLAVFGILCDVLTTLLIVLFAQRLGARTAVAFLAGLFYAAYPLAAIYSLLTMPNTLNALGLTAFSFAAFALLNREGRNVSLPHVFGIGLLGGILTLGFAGLIVIAVAVLALIVVKSKSISAAVLFLIGMAIPIAPVSIHNSKAEHQFVLLTTHGGFNYYMGNNELATGYPLRLFNFRMTAKAMLDDAHRYAEQVNGRTLSKPESSGWWKSQARKFWREHPGAAAQLTLKKIALFWNQRDMDDLRILEQLQITDPFFRYFKGTPFAVIGLLGLVGLLFARSAAVPRWILLAGMAGLVMFFITARYRLTFVPLMLVLGAAGVCRISGDWNTRWKHYLLLIIPSLILVCWPLKVRDQRPIDFYNAATQLTAAGKNDEAMAVIQRGLAIDPHFDQLYVARGGILFAQKKYMDAVESFLTARALNPSNALTSYNLALSYARAGNYCDARDALTESQRMGVTLDERTLSLLRELTAACDQ